MWKDRNSCLFFSISILCVCFRSFYYVPCASYGFYDFFIWSGVYLVSEIVYVDIYDIGLTHVIVSPYFFQQSISRQYYAFIFQKSFKKQEFSVGEFYLFVIVCDSVRGDVQHQLVRSELLFLFGAFTCSVSFQRNSYSGEKLFNGKRFRYVIIGSIRKYARTFRA